MNNSEFQLTVKHRKLANNHYDFWVTCTLEEPANVQLFSIALKSEDFSEIENFLSKKLTKKDLIIGIMIMQGTLVLQRIHAYPDKIIALSDTSSSSMAMTPLDLKEFKEKLYAGYVAELKKIEETVKTEAQHWQKIRKGFSS